MPMSGPSPEDVDGTLAQGDDRALGVLALAGPGPGAALLALAVEGVDRLDLYADNLFEGNLDLGLVRPRVDQERVLALVQQRVGLLRHDWGAQHVARVLAERRRGAVDGSGGLAHQACSSVLSAPVA